ncbi:MAG: CARDB domain-containing protein, partial [Halobacteriota archaeon]
MFLPIASAKVSVDVEHTPDTILPGDKVDYTVTLSNKGAYDVKVREIVLYTKLNVEPDSISDVGTIPTGSTYDFPFTVQAKQAGSYSIEMHVRTENETVKRLILVNVENKQPD